MTLSSRVYGLLCINRWVSLPGHNDVRTTQIYTHVLGQHFAGTHSPLDFLTSTEKQ